LKRLPYALETSVPGVFAVGDIRHRSVKRIASAVGEGSMVMQYVHQYLTEEDISHSNNRGSNQSVV
jgi:thioredoxin reductase (NADPH)